MLLLQNTTVVIYNINGVNIMDSTNRSDLSEIMRVLVRDLGLLERNRSYYCGITLAQCHAIVEIGRSEEINLNSLAELLNLNKSTMSRTINKLVDQNLVLREVHNENRRYIKIKLTENGDKIFKETEKSMEDYYNNIISFIPLCKKNQVLESLHVLVDTVKTNKLYDIT